MGRVAKKDKLEVGLGRNSGDDAAVDVSTAKVLEHEGRSVEWVLRGDGGRRRRGRLFSIH